MKSVILLFALATALASDPCRSPFRRFLKCAVPKFEEQVDSLMKEVSPHHKAELGECFKDNGCAEPEFDHSDPTSLFLEGKWKIRVNQLIQFIDQLPEGRPFHVCMIRRFKAYARDALRYCVQRYGEEGVQDSFEPPRIPGFENLDARDIKELFTVRLLTRHSLLQCADCKKQIPRAQSVESCVQGTRSGYDETICEDRENCIAEKLTGKATKGDDGYDDCEARYDAVIDAGCKCGREEFKSAGFGLLTRTPRLKHALVTLFKKDFEACYETVEDDFDEDYFDLVRKEIRQAFTEVQAFAFSGQSADDLPTDLKYALSVAKSLIGELVGKLASVFCGDCEAYEDSNINFKKILKEGGRC